MDSMLLMAYVLSFSFCRDGAYRGFARETLIRRCVMAHERPGVPYEVIWRDETTCCMRWTLVDDLWMNQGAPSAYVRQFCYCCTAVQRFATSVVCAAVRL